MIDFINNLPLVLLMVVVMALLREDDIEAARVRREVNKFSSQACCSGVNPKSVCLSLLTSGGSDIAGEILSCHFSELRLAD